ncbi:exported protein of unknown function [Blastococcus saxobsidens DD2]|uniref:Uncharacterized protein n=1 Tax=Blastococcus saxobsidens (strain DD2) TaxID=1146883 RepID=H6RVZ1_BLASD|nr:exported protein of unknown function [Blastococcus saxobsidens DD2]
MAVLAWLGVAGASLVAPLAVAAPSVTVPIRDVTPPVVSVDAGGSVTFVNEIQDKTVQVGGGGLLPALVDVTASTEVTLGLPSGTKVLTAPGTPGASVTERFDRSCATCTLTYTYALTSNGSLTAPLTDAALEALPSLPAPTPFVVNTILPDVPDVQGANLPPLPAVTLPPLPVQPPAPPAPPVPGEDREETVVDTPPAAPPVMQDPPGDPYTYGAGAGAVRLSPSSTTAAAAFDPSRFAVPGQGPGGAGRAGSSGAGGVAGSYDGASVPVFGQLAGLDFAALDEGSASEVVTASEARPLTLPAAALAAVVALAAVTAALVRTSASTRRPGGDGNTVVWLGRSR